jgi:hypothetical protein
MGQGMSYQGYDELDAGTAKCDFSTAQKCKIMVILFHFALHHHFPFTYVVIVARDGY